MEEQKYFRRGFKMRDEVQHLLDRDYRSKVVDTIRHNGNVLEADGLSLRLAKEFGFCYGVDRAVDYAFQTREKFPDRRIYITGDVIHNPTINGRLREMGVRFLTDDGVPVERSLDRLTLEDVVIIPAFGAPLDWVSKLKEKECIVVDTTCGSVLSVWKRVSRYAKRGFTSIIHGKYYHEETRATASQTTREDGANGKYLIVRNLKETGHVVDFILGKMSSEELKERLGHAMSEGFDPHQDLKRIGVANQTTMLMSETMAVGEALRQAMLERYGEDKLKEHFELFDTICSATQDRQDALFALLEHPLDIVVVIGGYNSSNTNNLAIIAKERVSKSYHISSGECIHKDYIRHKPAGTPLDAKEEVEERDWLPEGRVRIGLTAGASTPNSQIALAIWRILQARGLLPERELATEKS